MEKKLVDSELKVMNVIWREGDLPVKRIAEILKEETGWNVNTTYTLIKRCIEKGAVERQEPNFVCHALVQRETVQETEAESLLDRVFDGSASMLFASLLSRKKLSRKEIDEMRKLIDEMETAAAEES
ncbi:MAG: BlaI/MecI/CopY family transcriptional regulator [Lachnospiraceae bacterium]|nr:BlaI/MecI/CopY family transcriptional regulator [Lachnospiraceae bacterium]